jgi:hypothetical protein
MHRLILGVKDRKIRVDHKDRNGLNNQRNNLRIANVVQNAGNSRKRDNKTGFKGVSRRGKRFMAYIGVKGKVSYLGSFDTAELASVAYEAAANKYFGEFARVK